MTEQRIVNATTGGEKGQKLARFDLIPVGPLTQVATHYGVGAEKYADRNWERGVDWSLNYAAMQRHANAFWSGEDRDPETGTPHLAAVVFHAFALMEYAATHPELDDRPTAASKPQEPTLHEILETAVTTAATADRLWEDLALFESERYADPTYVYQYDDDAEYWILEDDLDQLSIYDEMGGEG